MKILRNLIGKKTTKKILQALTKPTNQKVLCLLIEGKVLKNMKLGNLKFFVIILFFVFNLKFLVFAENKIESVPLINLEELSPTFEEDKDILEKKEEINDALKYNESLIKKKSAKKTDKIYINIKALNKITVFSFLRGLGRM